MFRNTLVWFSLVAVAVVAGYFEGPDVRHPFQPRASVSHDLDVQLNLNPFDAARKVVQQAGFGNAPNKHHHENTYIHNVPPAPEPSATSYIATLSYGEGYPTIVYHCSITSHEPVTTTVVRGPNGHVCTVSYYKTPYHAHVDSHHGLTNQHTKVNPINTLLDVIIPPKEYR